MVNIIKGGTNIAPLLSAIILSGLRLTAEKKKVIKNASHNTIVKLPKNVINNINPVKPTKATRTKPVKPTKATRTKPVKPTKATRTKPVKPTKATKTKATKATPAKTKSTKPVKRKFKGGGAAEFFE